jgi:hypothetical protein
MLEDRTFDFMMPDVKSAPKTSGMSPAGWGSIIVILAVALGVALLVFSLFEVLRWVWLAGVAAGGLAIILLTRGEGVRALRLPYFLIFLVVAFFIGRLVTDLREPPESGRLQTLSEYTQTSIGNLDGLGNIPYVSSFTGLVRFEAHFVGSSSPDYEFDGQMFPREGYLFGGISTPEGSTIPRCSGITAEFAWKMPHVSDRPSTPCSQETLRVVVAGKLMRSDAEGGGMFMPVPPMSIAVVSVHAMCMVEAPFTCWTRDHPKGVTDPSLAGKLRTLN